MFQLHAARERRLGHPEMTRCRAHAAFFGDDQKMSELVEFHAMRLQYRHHFFAISSNQFQLCTLLIETFRAVTWRFTSLARAPCYREGSMIYSTMSTFAAGKPIWLLAAQAECQR